MKIYIILIGVGVLLLAVLAFISYKYIGGLASGWGGGTPAFEWNLTVNSYDELVENEGNIAHLEDVFQTVLHGRYKIKNKVRIDTVSEGNIHITVTATNIQVPEDVTEESYDAEWSRQNSANHIDDTFFPTKNQLWSITAQQKECIVSTIREQIIFIKDTDITIIDELGKED